MAAPMEDMLSDDPRPVFKSVKRRPRPLRTRPREADEDDDEDAEVLAKVEEAKELRRIRERPQGIDVLELAVGKKITDKEKIEVVSLAIFYLFESNTSSLSPPHVNDTIYT